jgi:hypothetical protein
MKIEVDENLKGKELVQFLKANKSALISEKKSLPIKFSDPVSSAPTFFNLKGAEAQKTAISEIPADATTVRVKVVANTALWCDSQLDVLLPDCWKTTIVQRKGMIKHLRDHEYKLAAEVGDVVNIYSQNISLTELGLNKAGSTQVLVFETDIKKAYDENTFNKYKAGKINQHSIGLQYVKIDLAIKDEEDEKEMDFWNKYAPLVINQDAIDRGYFFVVSEIKLLENSAVLFGSNELTPTLEVNAKTDTVIEPEVSTHEQPLQKSEAFDIQQLIKNLKSH